MLRFLHIILVFSVLAASSSWAFHDVDLESNVENIYLHAVEQSDVNDECDHFCHYSVHLIGLFSNTNFDIHGFSSHTESVVRDFLSSYSSPPIVPPPIA